LGLNSEGGSQGGGTHQEDPKGRKKTEKGFKKGLRRREGPKRGKPERA